MTEGALALMIAELGAQDCGGRPVRGGDVLNGGLACYGVYPTADGRYLAVGALEPKFWLALNAAIGRPANAGELVGDQAKIRGELAAIFATRTAEAWMEVLGKIDACVEIVVEPDELADHPLHRAREVFFEIDGGPGVGPVRQLRTPLGTPPGAAPPPRLGQHTHQVLREYGFTDTEILALIGD
jgi:crotonobetainyl-CoA:carnitine CoA-transferase CaiB-like acyl-CoA transferase